MDGGPCAGLGLHQETKIDLVHAHVTNRTSTPTLLLGIEGAPVATCHNWPGTHFSSSVYKLDHLLLRRSIECAAFRLRLWNPCGEQEYRPPRFALVPNGIDVRVCDIRLLGHGKFYAFKFCSNWYCWSIGSRQRSPILLLAAKEILNRCPKTEFYVIGRVRSVPN